MTDGDSTTETAQSPLRVHRLRMGWSQAAAMRRFEAALDRAGENAPEGASLKRMFAYWESGKRAVTVPAYQRALVEIYQTPAEALGFVPPDETQRVKALKEMPLHLVDVDDGLIELFAGQTQHLRMVDRRLGSATQAALVQAHVTQVEEVLRHSVGSARPRLASTLAEAAALAGWQALDRAELRSAWDFHEVAKAAALEGEDDSVTAHVLAQQGLVLIDARESALATQAVDAALSLSPKTPRLMRCWLAAAAAEALAADGQELQARRRLEEADALLDGATGDDGLPFLMLSPQHLARWRAHCFARLGDVRAVDTIMTALATESDSVRAATSMRTDLAAAHLNAGHAEAASEEARSALCLAERYGSRRQHRRLLAILARTEGQIVHQPDERPRVEDGP